MFVLSWAEGSGQRIDAGVADPSGVRSEASPRGLGLASFGVVCIWVAIVGAHVEPCAAATAISTLRRGPGRARQD